MSDEPEVLPTELPVAEQPVIEPDPVPPAAIISAQYDYDGVTIMCMITTPGETEPFLYAVNSTSPYGLSPFLREELAKGKVEIAPAPQAPAEE